MFSRSRNHGGNSCHGAAFCPNEGFLTPANTCSKALAPKSPEFPNRPRPCSCMGTASNSSAAAHTSRCLSPRCGHVSASWAKFRRRCMKAASRSSRPQGEWVSSGWMKWDKKTKVRGPHEVRNWHYSVIRCRLHEVCECLWAMPNANAQNKCSLSASRILLRSCHGRRPTSETYPGRQLLVDLVWNPSVRGLYPETCSLHKYTRHSMSMFALESAHPFLLNTDSPTCQVVINHDHHNSGYHPTPARSFEKDREDLQRTAL